MGLLSERECGGMAIKADESQVVSFVSLSVKAEIVISRKF
jgi:hypothetical protein